jgi:hypothetical protein
MREVEVVVVDSREELEAEVVAGLLLSGGFHVLDDVAERVRAEVRRERGERRDGDASGARVFVNG